MSDWPIAPGARVRIVDAGLLPPLKHEVGREGVTERPEVDGCYVRFADNSYVWALLARTHQPGGPNVTYESGKFKPGDKLPTGETFIGETEDGSPLWDEPVTRPVCDGTNDPAYEALEAVRAAIDARWREYLDGADAYDDEGAHVGLARHSRAVAEGLGQAHTIALRARDALASPEAR